MRVVITGGAGFIGSHTAERFAQAGWQPVILDDLSTGKLENVKAEWAFFRADVCDRSAVRRAIAEASAVVHLAAFTSVPDSFEHFRECFRRNVEGTYNILQMSLECGIRKVVFASSSAVYAELPDMAKSELCCPGPVSPYGISKLEGEHLLDIYRNNHGLDSVALRFFNVYGPRQAADSSYAAVVPIFINRIRESMPLIINGDGYQSRDFVHVADVAEAIYQCILSDVVGIYNVGTGRGVQILEIANMISGVFGRRSPHQFAPMPAGDIRSSTADITKITEALGWMPSKKLEDGLLEASDWYCRLSSMGKG